MTYIKSVPIKIISGGQTGVDRAALDVAIDLYIPHGGWCPRGRIAEDGVIAQHYQLQETASSAYEERTRCNVQTADATLILLTAAPMGGTQLTIELAQFYQKPYLSADLGQIDIAATLLTWLLARPGGVLNIAGPRESQRPGIYQLTKQILRPVLREFFAMTPSNHNQK